MAVDGLELLVRPGNDIVAQHAFHIVNWVFFAACIVAFVARVSVRFVCFRRLVLEDYLMMLALALHCVEASMIYLFVHSVYDIEALNKGDFSNFKGPSSLVTMKEGLVGMGTSLICTMIGVMIIKLNFLLFFRRLGSSFRSFNIAWWAVVIFTVAGTAAQLGTMTHKCMFSNIEYIYSAACASPAASRYLFMTSVFSAVVDAVSDVLIICFPIYILWNSGIDLRRKLILSGVFCLVFLTIAVTIVRGTVSHSQFHGNGNQERVTTQSPTFIWFWFYVEFSVAFIIACVVSFRTLFVQKSKKKQDVLRQQQRREEAYRSAIRRGRGWRNKFQQIQDSVLYTCKELEGWSGSEAETLAMRGLPTVPSGLMTVDFDDDSNWAKHTGGINKATTTTVTSVSTRTTSAGKDGQDPEKISGDHTLAGSVRSLLPSQPEQAHTKHGQP